MDTKKFEALKIKSQNESNVNILKNVASDNIYELWTSFIFKKIPAIET